MSDHANFSDPRHKPRTVRIRVAVISLDGDMFDLLETMENIEVVGFLDPSAAAADPIFPRLGDDNDWPMLRAKDPALRAVLAIDPPIKRAQQTAHYGLDSLLTIVAPTATLSRTAQLGLGSVVQRGVNVGRNSRVGLACRLNCEAYLHHDVVVGDFCTIAPGARLLGHVSIGRESYIGSGATILPRIRVGERVVVGAGAIVVRDVPDGVTVKGIPAK